MKLRPRCRLVWIGVLVAGSFVLFVVFRRSSLPGSTPAVDNPVSGQVTTSEAISLHAPPLLVAASMDDAEKIRALIAQGADVNERGAGHSHNTSLMEAAMWGKAKAVGALIDNGANINLKNDKGETALMLAVYWGGDRNINIIRILIAHGADVNADAKGETPLELALASGGDATETVKLLKQAGAVTRLDGSPRSRGRTQGSSLNDSSLNTLGPYHERFGFGVPF